MVEHTITGNDIVKKVAELRSVKYPELRSVAEFEWEDTDDIMNALVHEVCDGDERAAISCYHAVLYGQLLYLYLLARGYSKDFLLNAKDHDLARLFIEDRIDTTDYLIVMCKPIEEPYHSAVMCRNNMFTYMTTTEDVFVYTYGHDPESLYNDLLQLHCSPGCNISQCEKVPLFVFDDLSWDEVNIIKRGLQTIEPSVENLIETIK